MIPFKCVKVSMMKKWHNEASVNVCRYDFEEVLSPDGPEEVGKSFLEYQDDDGTMYVEGKVYNQELTAAE